MGPIRGYVELPLHSEYDLIPKPTHLKNFASSCGAPEGSEHNQP